MPPSRAEVICDAGRRSATLLGICLGAVAVVGLPIGLLAGMSFNRSLSLGLYLVGAFLTVAGFFVGNRGPVRGHVSDGVPGRRGGRALRRATREEQLEGMAVSAVFVLLGFVLMALGVIVDSRVDLV